MRFNEAVKAMKEGSKVTREQWKGSVYFQYVKSDNGKVIHTFQPKLMVYAYDEDIMGSDGWQIEGIEGEFAFCDIIEFLKSQKKARLNNWDKDSFIQYDPQSAALVYFTMEPLTFTPTFDSFVAQDWIIV